MICPNCGQEYREGVETCAECGTALVAEAPAGEDEEDAEAGPEAEWRDLAAVLVSIDIAELTVARSMLEAAGIPVFARGDTLQEFFGFGRLNGGVSAIGPVRLEVPSEREAEARELLAARSNEPPDEPYEE